MGRSLEKRLKRHILSKTYHFLGVVQPAFRETVRREMEEKGFSVTGEVEGGVEFEGNLEEGWRANLVLRTISRVYCRIAAFKVGAREELYRKAKGIPWELWINPTVPVRIEASAHRSRIHHEGIMRETLLEAIEDRWQEAGYACLNLINKNQGMRVRMVEGEDTEEDQGEKDSQKILIYSEGNQCTISLDMSGEGLYRRGYRTLPGEAPIREDIAAALLWEGGWKGEGILCDPMTGSGTFSIEAILMGLSPGGNQKFRFQNWPSFREPRWNYIKKQAFAKTQPGISPAASMIRQPLCFASDWEEEALETVKINCKTAGVEEYILFEQKDFFSLDGEYVESRIRSARIDSGSAANRGTRDRRFLVLNPPYGKRLPVEQGYYLRIGEHIRKSFPRWQVLLLLPASVDVSALVGSRVHRRIVFRHGGLRIQALFFVNDE